MSKYDNLDLALRAKFTSLGFDKYDITGHVLDVFRDWDRMNEETKNELYEMSAEEEKRQEERVKYL